MKPLQSSRGIGLFSITHRFSFYNGVTWRRTGGDPRCAALGTSRPFESQPSIRAAGIAHPSRAHSTAYTEPGPFSATASTSLWTASGCRLY